MGTVRVISYFSFWLVEDRFGSCNSRSDFAFVFSAFRFVEVCVDVNSKKYCLFCKVADK